MCGDPIENGELIIKDGNIVEIVTQSGNDDTALDLSDYLLMPGFINAHSHISLTAFEKKNFPYRFICKLDSRVDLSQLGS